MTTPDPPFVGARPWLSSVVAWATAVHAEQVREVDNAPFVLHPLEVASTLSSRGYDDAVVAAGLLHDAVEKTETTIEAVRERCGDRVAAIVAAVTEDDTITDYAERKSKLRAQMAAAGVDAHAVYAADKLTKARELRAQVARDRQAVTDPAFRQRLGHYEDSLELLRSVAAEVPMVEQLAFELWALRVLPPAR